MKRQTKVEVTAETIKAVIAEHRPTSMSQLAHAMGFRGNVSGSLAKRVRALCPDVDGLLAKAAGGNKANPKPGKPTDTKAAKPPKATAGGKQGKPKAVAAKGSGKYPRDPRNPFRATSAYGVCFDILALAAHKNGLPKKELISLLAKDIGKDEKHAGFDVQVLLSAKPNEKGLNNNDSPRHAACRPGFYVKREGDLVILAVD